MSAQYAKEQRYGRNTIYHIEMSLFVYIFVQANAIFLGFDYEKISAAETMSRQTRQSSMLKRKWPRVAFQCDKKTSRTANFVTARTSSLL